MNRTRTSSLDAFGLRDQRDRIYPALEASDGSTLSLDFTAMGGTLDSRFTFTRASTATYINSAGVVTTMAAASTNDPTKARFDYDPTTLALRGLLIEGSATNLLQQSADYSNAYWNKVNTTIETTSVTCPDNISRTTVRVKDSGTTNVSHALRRNFATSNGTTYTLSFWVKKGSTNTFAVQIYADATFNTTLSVSNIDNNTQTVSGGTGVNASATRVAYPNGWYRYAYTFTASSAAAPDINFHPRNLTGSYVAVGDHTDFFGIQLETGSGASSYIPTVAGQGTRSAEACSMTGSNFSSWYGAPSAFTVLLEGITVSSGTYNRILNFSSGANTTGSFSNANIGIANASSNRPFLNVFVTANNDVDAYVPLAGAVTNGVSFKVAARCQAGLYRITRGVGLSTSSAHNGFPAGLANLYFGGSSGSYQLSTHYSKLQFWATALSNSQMDALVT